MVSPAIPTLKFVQADFAGAVKSVGEIGNDHRQMPPLRDHWMGLVDAALAIPARMGMDVGDDLHAGLLAEAPDRIHLRGVEHDDALQGGRIDHVVGDEIAYMAATALDMTKQKAPAFLPAAAAFTQLAKDLLPEAPRAVQPLRRVQPIVDTPDHG